MSTENLPKSGSEEENDRHERVVHYLENTKTIDMLLDIYNNEPPIEYTQHAERLVNDHKMPMGVVNVLMHYVSMRNDGKVTRDYIDRIASHWILKKVDSVNSAIDISRDYNEQYKAWKNEKGTTTRSAIVGKVEIARLYAIEAAVYDSSKTDEQLGKYVRTMFNM